MAGSSGQDVGLQWGLPGTDEGGKSPRARAAARTRPSRECVTRCGSHARAACGPGARPPPGRRGLIVSRSRPAQAPQRPLPPRALSWCFFCPVFFFSKECFWPVEQSQSAQMCRNHYESLSCGNKIINQKCIFRSSFCLL